MLLRCESLEPPILSWVKMRKPRNEHMSAGLPPIADIAQRDWHGRKVPKVDINHFSERRGMSG